MKLRAAHNRSGRWGVACGVGCFQGESARGLAHSKALREFESSRSHTPRTVLDWREAKREVPPPYVGGYRRHEARRSRGGFTLIELLLTLVLLMLLLGAVVMNFSGLQSSSQLDEGVEQFESLVRYARAHAANSGCRVKLTFEEVASEGEAAVPLGNVFVSWEADPLNKPGEFQPLQEVAPLLETMLQFVEVDEVRPVGSGLVELAPPEAGSGEQSYGFEPIVFYPDGSSDTAEVIFSARESDEERQVAVQIIGATGTVRRHAMELAGFDGTRPLEGGVREK